MVSNACQDGRRHQNACAKADWNTNVVSSRALMYCCCNTLLVLLGAATAGHKSDVWVPLHVVSNSNDKTCNGCTLASWNVLAAGQTNKQLQVASKQDSVHKVHFDKIRFCSCNSMLSRQWNSSRQARFANASPTMHMLKVCICYYATSVVCSNTSGDHIKHLHSGKRTIFKRDICTVVMLTTFDCYYYFHDDGCYH